MKVPNAADETIVGPTEPAVGERLPTVAGYEMLELLGRGGMGRVYRARHLELDRIVALKLLPGDAGEDAVARFKQEIQAVAALRHAHIAQIFEAGLADGLPFFSMEFVPGGSLAQWLARRAMEPFSAARLAATLAHAVQHAHDRGIIHRDLKPGNILLDSAGAGAQPEGTRLVPKIADFGLAKRLTGSGLTRTGDIVGTPSYMAPEQASGLVANVGVAADVYALGAILYECLTGRPPFIGPDPLQTVMMVLTLDPVSPRQLQPKLPADLETICMKCLEKSPGHRYASAAEFGADLERFLEGRPIRARRAPAWERGWKWAKRKPWQATAAALALLSVVGAGVGIALLEASNRETRQANESLTKSNEALAVQRNEADELLTLALRDLDQFTFELSDKLYEIPQGETLRRDVLERARASLQAFDRVRPTDPKVRKYQREGYDKLADAEMRLGRLPEALSAESRAHELATALAQEAPSEQENGRRLAVIGYRMAMLQLNSGNRGECERFTRIADERTAKLTADNPNDPASVELEALMLHHRYRLALSEGDRIKAEAAFRSCADAHRRVTSLDPANRERRQTRATVQMQLASFLGGAGKQEEGLALLAEVEDVLADAATEPTIATRKAKADVHWTRGDLHASQKRAAEAEKAYRRALAEYKALADDFPKTRSHRLVMVQVHLAVGSAWKKAGDAVRGRPDVERARDLLDTLDRERPADATSRYLRDWAAELLQDTASVPKKTKS